MAETERDGGKERYKERCQRDAKGREMAEAEDSRGREWQRQRDGRV